MCQFSSVHPSYLTPESPSDKGGSWFSLTDSLLVLAQTEVLGKGAKGAMAYLILTARKSEGGKRSFTPDLVVQACNPSYLKGRGRITSSRSNWARINSKCSQSQLLNETLPENGLRDVI